MGKSGLCEDVRQVAQAVLDRFDNLDVELPERAEKAAAVVPGAWTPPKPWR